jgi:uncharacterized protein YkwD
MGKASKARGVAACAIASCALLLPGAAPADGPAAQSSCTNQDVRVSAVNRAQLETSLLCLTNSYRAAMGLAPVGLDIRLQAASRAHSEDMVARNYFEHTSPDGRGPAERAAAAGYPGDVGENIAYNSAGTIRVLFEAWRDSPGHEQNMLDPAYAAVGIGLAVGRPGGSGITGGQLFGTSPADTSETGVADEADDAGKATGSAKCEAARRALATKRSAYRKSPWVTSPAKVKRLRAEMRRAKRRYDKACAAA